MSVKEGETTGETQFHEKEFLSLVKSYKNNKMNYRFANNIRLHQDKESPFINFVQVKEVTAMCLRN
ncbi:MAG: hypothetical protein HOP07_18555 [Bacteriovoracaceae bacterium]|nr:hypothetical protein [Bacteriovoracaceae bacterium]